MRRQTQADPWGLPAYLVTSRLLRDRVSVKTKVGSTRYNDSQGPPPQNPTLHTFWKGELRKRHPGMQAA